MNFPRTCFSSCRWPPVRLVKNGSRITAWPCRASATWDWLRDSTQRVQRLLSKDCAKKAPHVCTPGPLQDTSSAASNPPARRGLALGFHSRARGLRQGCPVWAQDRAAWLCVWISSANAASTRSALPEFCEKRLLWIPYGATAELRASEHSVCFLPPLGSRSVPRPPHVEKCETWLITYSRKFQRNTLMIHYKDGFQEGHTLLECKI